MSEKASGTPRLDLYFHSRLNTWLVRNGDDIDFSVKLTNEDKICAVTMYTEKAQITRRYIVSAFMNTTDLRSLVDLAVQHIYWELADLLKNSMDG